MLERQREAAMRTGRRVAENPAPALMVIGLAMLLIAVLGYGGAYWFRGRRRMAGATDGGGDE